MIQKTKDYEMFKFRSDNRKEITKSHVQTLMNSIKSKNLLELRPIIVNEQLEVIDGQHRLLAAKALGFEIYYEINKDLAATDIIALNVAKAWGTQDYLNYYVKQGNQEYIKLDKFIKANGLNLKIALSLTQGPSRRAYNCFKKGEYKMENQYLQDYLSICKDTLEFIIRMGSKTKFVESSKFWKSLLVMVKHPHFNQEKWQRNLEKFIERVVIKATDKDYLKMFLDIYNYQNKNKIKFDEELLEE